MTPDSERLSALVALMRCGGRAWMSYVFAVRRAGDAGAVDPQQILERELGLLSFEAQANAAAEVAAWTAKGYRLLTLSDPDYPANLRVLDGRPPLLFTAGRVSAADVRSVAVIGTRTPSDEGRTLARELSSALSQAGHTVVSGLAAGIDSEAHLAALTARRRTLAVLGTGLEHAYPPQNAQLQARIAVDGALISQFWPDSGPTRRTFPERNAVMSGLTQATVIVEAGEQSGTRIQARHALAQGRPVILMAPVLRRQWALELSQRTGVIAAETPAAVVDLLR